jgi:hypothetical protein
MTEINPQKTPEKGEFSDLKKRLFDRFGIKKSFTPRQYADLFTGEEIPKLPAMFEEMLKRGEIVAVPDGFQLVRRDL